MNKVELVAAIAEKSGLSKKDAEKALAATLDSVHVKIDRAVVSIDRNQHDDHGVVHHALTLGEVLHVDAQVLADIVDRTLRADDHRDGAGSLG